MLEKSSRCNADFKDSRVDKGSFRKENTGMVGRGKSDMRINSANFNPSSRFISSDKSSDYYTFRVK